MVKSVKREAGTRHRITEVIPKIKPGIRFWTTLYIEKKKKSATKIKSTVQEFFG